MILHFGEATLRVPERRRKKATCSFEDVNGFILCCVVINNLIGSKMWNKDEWFMKKIASQLEHNPTIESLGSALEQWSKKVWKLKGSRFQIPRQGKNMLWRTRRSFRMKIPTFWRIILHDSSSSSCSTFVRSWGLSRNACKSEEPKHRLFWLNLLLRMEFSWPQVVHAHSVARFYSSRNSATRSLRTRLINNLMLKGIFHAWNWINQPCPWTDILAWCRNGWFNGSRALRL